MCFGSYNQIIFTNWNEVYVLYKYNGGLCWLIWTNTSLNKRTEINKLDLILRISQRAKPKNVLMKGTLKLNKVKQVVYHDFYMWDFWERKKLTREKDVDYCFICHLSDQIWGKLESWKQSKKLKPSRYFVLESAGKEEPSTI